MKNVMLDLETWGNTPNSVIVQIGACYFDRYTGKIGDTFIKNINAESSLKEGFEITASTIYWWMSQEKDALDSICSKGYSVKSVINSFNGFIKKAKYIWSHATFDFVIIMNHFNKLNIKPKFGFRDARDLRTIVDLTKVDYKSYEKCGIAHNALDDCFYQVKYAVDCFNKLKR